MIDDLDKTLETLLTREAAPQFSPAANVTFGKPGKEPAPNVNLFLFDVRENLELRNNEWQVERAANGNLTKTPPPVRVDCSYLITAWTNEEPATDEHQLLGQVMKVLLRHRTLPSYSLQGTLRGQQPPQRASVIQAEGRSSAHEFWQTIGKPKAVLHYTVTISVDVSDPVDVGPPVTDKLIKIKQGVG